MTNPYAAALDGLDLPDPVAAFFRFCRERERVRVNREAGQGPPWTEDVILRRARFLNVFREDDRGTKAVLRFAAAARDSLPRLIHALFFARWINRSTSLDALSVADLDRPAQVRRVLSEQVPQPWNNPHAYPVGPVQWQGRSYEPLEALTELFPRISEELAALVVDAKGDVVSASRAINAQFAMANDFPIFTAIIDVAWFRPDIIDPNSRVPTGIGAVAFLDRLQRHLGLPDHHATSARMIALQAELWPEARRPLHPVDVEYLACECRKYYSYINGTKTFEGRNLFTPHRGDAP